MILPLLFWLLLFLILYTYLLYPEWMKARGEGLERHYPDQEELPSLDLLVAAYNEEASIDEKIRSCLETDYPAEKIRVVIGSDCSSDQTDALVKSWQEKDPRVVLRRFDTRTGKPAIINQLVKESEADILVMSDADTRFETTTLGELVRPFVIPGIGGVQSRFVSVADSGNDVARQEIAYNNREYAIKKGQSRDYAVIGAYGACYAMRRSTYVPVPEGYLVDDFYLFMKVLEQGSGTVVADKAVSHLEISGSGKVEFRRKSRIGMGNYQNFFALKKFRNPFGSRAAFHYWSHKVLRWFTPFFLIAVFLLNAELAVYSVFYRFLLIGQLLGYLIWPLDVLFRRSQIHFAPFRYISHFVSMNLALLRGFFRYLRGGSNGTWR